MYLIRKRNAMDMLLLWLCARRFFAYKLFNYFAERFYGSNKTADVIKHTHSQCTFLFSRYILHAVLFSCFYYVSRRSSVTCTRYGAGLCIGCLEISALCASEYHKACCIIQAVVVLLSNTLLYWFITFPERLTWAKWNKCMHCMPIKA